jgi:hypothetical protein
MLTELGIAGADASTIQVIAGHEDIRTSQRYLHPTPEHVLMAFERTHAMRGKLATASQRCENSLPRVRFLMRALLKFDRSQNRTAAYLQCFCGAGNRT